MSGRGLAEIVRALGGDLYAGGRRASVPGPGHSRTDRSVSLALEGDRVLIHSFAGDDGRRVRDELQRRRLIDGSGVCWAPRLSSGTLGSRLWARGSGPP